MEPTALAALINAMMSALGVWQRERDYRATQRAFEEERSRSLASEEVQATALDFARLEYSGHLPSGTMFLLGQRAENCWQTFNAKIDPDSTDGSDPDTAEAELAECLCGELRRIKRLNGTIPEGPWRNWWNSYGCGPYIR